MINKLIEKYRHLIPKGVNILIAPKEVIEQYPDIGCCFVFSEEDLDMLENFVSTDFIQKIKKSIPCLIYPEVWDIHTESFKILLDHGVLDFDLPGEKMIPEFLVLHEIGHVKDFLKVGKEKLLIERRLLLAQIEVLCSNITFLSLEDYVGINKVYRQSRAEKVADEFALEVLGIRKQKKSFFKKLFSLIKK